MLKKTFQLSTETTTYPVVRNWGDLDESQREACYAQGYDEDKTLFWFDEDGVAYCSQEDLRNLEGVFAISGWDYYLFCHQNTYLARLDYEGGVLTSISIVEIREIQETI